MEEQVIRNIWAEKMYIGENEKYSKETIRKYWKSTAVFTDFLRSEMKQELPETELLPGEIIASVSKVGCYIVRNAIRLYNIHELGYSPEKETPASVADVELVRNDMGDSVWCEWRDRLRLTHEVSARHCDDRSGEFTYICRAAEARNYSWSEVIGGICTAKKYPLLPDNYASLFVCNTYMGSSFSSETWYKFSCNGRIKTLHLHPYGDGESARFEEVSDSKSGDTL